MIRIASYALFLTLLLCTSLYAQPPGCSDTYIYSDVLFVVDNSGSITDAEYADFEAIMVQTVSKVRANCPTANVAIVHYGGDLGDSTIIQYDFSDTTAITSMSRQFCPSNPLGTCVSGDDLNTTIGNIMDFFVNGDLSLTPDNRLSVVIMTDAFGGEIGPCDLVNCSAIRPYTNIDILKANYEANVLVVGVEPDADAAELAPYASLGGYYAGVLNGDCLGTFDGCNSPRQYIPIQFADDVAMASDSIANSVQCQVIMVPGIGVNVGADTTICDSGAGLASLMAVPLGGTAPFIYEWDNALGFGASKNVSPLVNTTYTVTITDANDCQETDQVTVFVTPCVPDCSDDIIYSDILFVIDNSGSITDSEYADFESIMVMTIDKLQATCPLANIAVVHYGGDLGDSTIIEHNFSNIATVNSINRQFCISNPLGTCVSGDDLNTAMGNIMNYFVNGDLTLTPQNRLSVVIFTDAFGGEIGPCDLVNCSAIRPYTNVSTLKTNYNANVLVVGIEPDADAAELAPYASVGGAYTGIMNTDCAGAADGCTTPRQYIPIQFSDDIEMASDSISKSVECTAIILPKVAVEAGSDQSICGNLGGSATIMANATIGIPPYIYEWSHSLGFGSTKNVSPPVTTKYFVTVTDANTCSAVDSITVIVKICDDCLADAGDPLALEEVCLGNGNVKLYTDENQGINKPAGYEEVYFLTDENLTVVNYRVGKGNFTVTSPGLYRIHTLIAEVTNKNSPEYLDLSIVKVGMSNLFTILNCIQDHGICADFDLPGRIHIVLGPDEMMCMSFENSINLCSDGIDNDGDGLVDCNDDDCFELINCQENTLLACNDLFDNDNDGLVDCNDPECYQFVKCFERGAQCGDGIDNDGDGLIDCNDGSCAGSSECEEDSPFTCLDGKDNDLDGLIDCEEASCKQFLVCAEFSASACSDGIDNDFDGLVDCADIDCQNVYSSVCSWAENTNALCSDGKDNDGNGLIDCNDPNCGFIKLQNLQPNLEDYLEVVDASCPNNDNGAIGLSLPAIGLSLQYSIDGGQSFQNNSLFTDLSPGQYSVFIATAEDCFVSVDVNIEAEPCPEICGNGKDDDGDGLTDCDDGDCGLIQLMPPIVNDANCPDNDDGNFMVSYKSGNGSTNDVQYSINGSNYKSFGYFKDLVPGNYTVHIRNSTGCNEYATINIGGQLLPEIDDIVIIDAVCPGNDNGALMIMMQGQTTGHNYSIDGGNSFQQSPQFNDLNIGVYQIMVVTDKGCIVESSAEIKGGPCVEICDNGIDDDDNGFTDCDDQACGFEETGPVDIKLSLQNGNDTYISSSTRFIDNTFGQEEILSSISWTDFSNGSPEQDNYTLINFVFEEVAQMDLARLDKAVMTLHFPPGSNYASGGQYGSNASRIHLINEVWSENETTWNNQPDYEETKFKEIPSNNDYDSIQVEVTELIKELINNDYYGFLIKPVNPDPYRSMIFASSEHPDPSKAPGLRLEFKPYALVQPTCFNKGMVEFHQTSAGWQFSLNGTDYQDSPKFSDLDPGQYSAHILNENGCEKWIAFSLVEPVCIEICQNGIDDDGDGLADCLDTDCGLKLDSIGFNIITENSTCPYNNNGFIEIIYPFDSLEFSLDNINFSSSSVLDSLAPGVYSVYMRNDHGCEASFDIQISGEACVEICNNELDDDGDGLIDCEDGDCAPVADSLPIGILVIDATCPENNNASFELTNTQEGQSFSLDDSSYQSEPMFIDLYPGVYTLYISNEYGCQDTMEVEIGGELCLEICDNGLDDDGDGLTDCNDSDCGINMDSLLVKILTTDATCPENINGIIEVIDSPAGYSYSLDDSSYQAGSAFINLSPGMYTLYALNENGCRANFEVEIGGELCLEICDNGLDDDGDGLIDCEDESCKVLGDSSLVNILITDATCPENNDGGIEISNSPDGYLYSLDYSFYTEETVYTNLSPGDYMLQVITDYNCEESIAIVVGGELCIEICDNGLDDDKNGLVDCDDPACGFSEQGQYFVKLNSLKGKDAIVSNSTIHLDLNFGDHHFITATGWTDFANNSPQKDFRILIDFPISEILAAENSPLELAEMTLYADPNLTDPNGQSGMNDAIVHIITEPWEEDEVTWNTQPNYLETPNVEIPANNNYTKINVDLKPLIEKIKAENLEYFGFIIKHKVEDPYRRMVFTSKEYEDPNLSPELQLSYSKGYNIVNATCTSLGIIEFDQTSADWQFSLNGIDYQSSPVFNNLTAGEYTGYIMNENGCEKTVSLEITVPPCIELCSNGLDDDEDGLIDCDDDDCLDDLNCNSFTSPSLTMNLSVLLQGPYDSDEGQMKTELNENGYLPGQDPSTYFGTRTPEGQPYNVAPWFYEGNEMMKVSKSKTRGAQYDPDVVDWILVSLRSEASKSTEVWIGAALLYSDGYILPMKQIDVDANDGKEYYVVIEHRNHLPVMSKRKAMVKGGQLSYDFRKEDSYSNFIGLGQIKAADGSYTMIAGNGELIVELSSDIDINVRDFNCWLQRNGLNSSYFPEDYDLNGDINIKDRIIWETNNGMFSTISTKK